MKSNFGKIRILISFLISLVALSVNAQDATFSQYYASSLYLNPAFAGIENRLTFSSNYRTQWKSIVTPYVTSQASLIVPIKLKKNAEMNQGGIGLSVYNNKAGDGDFQTLGANLSIGYNVHLSSMSYLSLGVQGGYVQKRINLSNLQWGTQFNPLIGGYDPGIAVNTNMINSSTSFSDFAGGIMYYYNPTRDYEQKGFSFYAGAAAYHLTQPNESMLKDSTNGLPMLLKSHIGIEWNLSDKFNFSPNGFFAMQNGRKQINAGAYLTYLFGSNTSAFAPGQVLLGGWYRLDDSFIFTVGMGSNNYTLGFSYDLNNSSLRYNTQGRGAYEISLKVQIGSSRKVRIYNPLI